jgi:hypothetical protein
MNDLLRQRRSLFSYSEVGLGPWNPQFVHLYGQLEEVIKALALCLRLRNSVTPHISK